MPTATCYPHIVTDASGTAFISETKMKVTTLVLDHLAYGWSPEELLFQHPGLTLGQIHSALAYYWDHQAEIDAQIEATTAQVDELRARQPRSAVADRLARLKRRP
jgi:uncharacterized protein (DUF433 family)